MLVDAIVPAACQGYPLQLTVAVPGMERVMGIEPTSKAWEAFVLPLNYTRMSIVFSSVSKHVCPDQIPLYPLFVGSLYGRRAW